MLKKLVWLDDFTSSLKLGMSIARSAKYATMRNKEYSWN